MTTAFQTVIDYAESISINKRRKIAQTTSRDGTVKTTSLGGQLWEFEVTLPSGPSWQTFRPLIERMEALDRVTVGQIQINSSGQSWLSKYQGNLGSTSGITVSYSSGNTVTITAGATGLSAGQFRFRSGDFVQLGASNSVYTVVNDVAHNVNTITLNRPVREAAGSYSLIVGPLVTWDVICVQFPKWTIFARDQISWDGPFTFVEAI
jgi:hypothetical protein